MAHHGWSRSLYLRERDHSTRNRLQTLGPQLRNSPDRSEGLGTQNRKCPARPGPPGRALLAPSLQAGGCSPQASTPGGCSPRASRPVAARSGPPGRWLLAPGLHARGCSLWLTVPEAVPVPERWAHTNTNTRQALGSLLRISRGSSEG